ncbi:MAG: hypothetical protein Q8O55_05700 [Dehalococcoidales bacterium]|nr:hypothetical protein [Dehalococcoidales bacterium]
MADLTINGFAKELPGWYRKYAGSRYFLGYEELESNLSQKAISQGCLEMDDLAKIAEWGGNQHGVKQRMMAANTEAIIREATQQAILNLADPVKALESLYPIREWGLTYSSKTLRFIRPQDYPALDSVLKGAVTKSYTELISKCRRLQELTSVRGPRADSSWWIADVEMALFWFCFPYNRGGGGGRLIEL